MSRFQFSLRRLLVFLSLQCVAAWLARIGVADGPRDAVDDFAWLGAWVIFCAGLGLFAKDEILGFFLGGAAAIALLVIFSSIFVFPPTYVVVVPFTFVVAAWLIGFLREEARISDLDDN